MLLSTEGTSVILAMTELFFITYKSRTVKEAVMETGENGVKVHQSE